MFLSVFTFYLGSPFVKQRQTTYMHIFGWPKNSHLDDQKVATPA